TFEHGSASWKISRSLSSAIKPRMCFCNVWGAEIRGVLRPTWVAQKKSDRRWTLNPRKSEQYSMCGITGFLDTSSSKGHEELCAIAQRMATSLRHRGPEDEGIWAD